MMDVAPYFGKNSQFHPPYVIIFKGLSGPLERYVKIKRILCPTNYQNITLLFRGFVAFKILL